jgi:hypothetical protein
MRIVVPLAVLAAIAMAPLLVIAARLGVAADPAAARSQLVLGWACAAGAWMFQLWLVAGASPAARANLTLRRALAAGAANLARAAVPWAIAVIAIGLGFAALLVPGCVLLVLFAQTGASVRVGEPPLTSLSDGVASVRRHLRRVIVIVALLVAADLAIAAAAHVVIVHVMVPAKPASAALAATRTFARVVVLAATAIAPVPAWLLARAYSPKA